MGKRVTKEARGKLMGLIRRHMNYEQPHENPYGVYRAKVQNGLVELILSRLNLRGGAADAFRCHVEDALKSKLTGISRADVPVIVDKIWKSYRKFILDIMVQLEIAKRTGGAKGI